MSPQGQIPESAFTFLSHGASIQEFNVAGQNIVLGFPEAQIYKSHNAPYFGETIGRTTNRIKDAQIHDLNGKTYDLYANDGPNCLHGGQQGWGKKGWDGRKKVMRGEKEGMLFTHLSKDGEEGYPGTVEARVWYTAGKQGENTVLDVEYEVEFVGAEGEAVEETVVGVTNHSYFNLNPSAPTIAGTRVTLGTDQYLVLDSNSIPTGEIKAHPSAAPPNTTFTIGETSPSFDDCMVLSPPSQESISIPLDTRPQPLRHLVTLSHPDTGLHLEIESTEPAFQFYTGEHIDVPELETSHGKKVPAKGSRAGIAVEPSRYVDAQRKEWRGQCLLKKGEMWGARSRYKAWKE
ncbi:aldose 1-epimerase, partial [Lecanoromycetidae sp. Uapishka_2]